VDVLRGAALLMIFVDHMPGNPVSYFTLHNFGFADAAEIFVLLAGFASMMAYGRVFARDGAVAGLRRVGARCLRIYVCHAFLLLFTLALVRVWTQQFHLEPTIVKPILDAGMPGLLRGLMLNALPSFLNILPLYVVLLAVFPLVYLAVRRSIWLALGGAVAVWLGANLDHRLTLPNWLDANGWYFNPFTWQLLFVIGAVLAVVMTRTGGSLPYRHWLAALCGGYLCFAFFQTFEWTEWHLTDLRPLEMEPPDKSRLSPLRMLDILALFYLLFSAPALRRLARHRFARAIEACGKHSLEIFALGCMLALVGRLLLRTWGHDWPLLAAVNVTGLATMCLTALWMERERVDRSIRPIPAAAE
jgi:hypothetical protein